jgi:hypothetical protein
MPGNAAVTDTAAIIPFARPRREPEAAPNPMPDRRAAVERLRRRLPEDSLVYVTRRWFNPANEWLIVDFFHIDGHSVTCITEDVAVAIDRYDPEREVGLKLYRPGGMDPLAVLIDGTLSRVLHGAGGAVQHVVIG